MEHKHEGFVHAEGFVHNHAISDPAGAFLGLKDPVEPFLGEEEGGLIVPVHTMHNLCEMSVRCDCGYKGEFDTYGEYGFWWKWFLHVHVHEGHSFTISGNPFSVSMVI